MAKLISIEVKPSRQFPFLGRHPWVHASSIVEPSTEISVGEQVDLVMHDGTWIARGLYHPESKIRVRLYSWDPADRLDDAFFNTRIDRAIALRESCGLQPDCDAVRLVFSEADGISGLIVDRYQQYLMIQVTAAVIEKRIEPIVKHLCQRLNPQAVILRSDPSTAKAEQMEQRTDVLNGDPPPTDLMIREHQVSYAVDLMHSQKTGLYLDQRRNRQVAAQYARGRVLDVCSYVGGFAMNVARSSEVEQVLGLDTSEKVVALAKANAEINGLSDKTEFVHGDCFDMLEAFKKESRQFDCVILDPPRFAGSRRAIDAALRAYRRLNHLAVSLLPPGGRLITCSCSGRVQRADFTHLVQTVGRQAGRDVLVLESRGADVDHPVLLSCPETDYLKCLVCEIR